MNEADKKAFYEWFRRSDCLAISECSEAWQAALAHRDKQAGEPVEFEYPEFSYTSMGCGLEDRNITDRYDAMMYGWNEALERVAEVLKNLGPIYNTPPAAQVNEVDKWKAIAEFQYAIRVYPDNLELGQGALDAWAKNWKGFEVSIANAAAKAAKGEL